MSKIKHDAHENLSVKHDAFPYQREAVEAIRDKPYAAIFHEQGLGKTKIAIDILLYWIEVLDIDCVMIITKKQLISNWEEEFASHTYLKTKTLSNRRKDNFYVFNSNARIILTNFETISLEKERIKLFLETRDVGVIIDESTKIKNPTSKLTQNFFEISSLFKKRIIMTGTPIANRPYDIWAQIYFLDSGNSLGTNFEEFKSTTDLSNDLYSNKSKQQNFEESVATIFSKIKNFTVRETKNSGIISLPNKVYHDIYTEFEHTQKKMYDHVRNEMQIMVQKGNNAILDESPESIKRLLRLIQITSNPLLLDCLYGQISSKERELDKIITEITNREEKVIVWSIFTDNIDYFTKKYSTHNAVKITGKMNIGDRKSSVKKFKEDNSKILFATPQAAKEGLTLTVANNVIFYDRGFSLDDYLQAQDRIHRISQTKECNIYNLMVKNSIDVWIDKLLRSKQNAAFLAQGDKTLSQYQINSDYSYGEMIKDILKIE